LRQCILWEDLTSAQGFLSLAKTHGKGKKRETTWSEQSACAHHCKKQTSSQHVENTLAGLLDGSGGTTHTHTAEPAGDCFLNKVSPVTQIMAKISKESKAARQLAS